VKHVQLIVQPVLAQVYAFNATMDFTCPNVLVYQPAQLVSMGLLVFAQPAHQIAILVLVVLHIVLLAKRDTF